MMIVSAKRDVYQSLHENTFCPHAGVIIGFVEDLVTVNEADMFASLTVRILSGSLMQKASALVGFSTGDASAQCMC